MLENLSAFDIVLLIKFSILVVGTIGGTLAFRLIHPR